MITVKNNFDKILRNLTIGDHFFDPKEYGINDPHCENLNVRVNDGMLKIDQNFFESMIDKGIVIETKSGFQTRSKDETALYFNAQNIRYFIAFNKDYKYTHNDYDFNITIYTNFQFV